MEVPTRAEIAARIAELAFSRPEDAVKLAIDPEAGAEGLDLRLVSGIKRSKDGSMELRLIDREELIKLLVELTAPADDGAGARSDEFYAALDSAARAVADEI